MEITIKTQAELDKLPDRFGEFTYIYIKSADTIYINKARWNSSVVAWENSSVVAWENSSVVARDNSSVVAWGNSSVEARDNSSVEARDNSSVVAWGNSSVEARDRVTTQVFSEDAVILLFSFAVAVVSKILKHKIERKSRTAHIQEYELLPYMEREGVEAVKGEVILYKKVSKDFKTQEGTKNETLWEIGKTITIKTWEPGNSECGEGKFHAVSRPYFGDEFRGVDGDRYIAIKIKVGDLYEWTKNPEYIHKIGFRSGKVLWEVDRWGDKVELEGKG